MILKLKNAVSGAANKNNAVPATADILKSILLLIAFGLLPFFFISCSSDPTDTPQIENPIDPDPDDPDPDDPDPDDPDPDDPDPDDPDPDDPENYEASDLVLFQDNKGKWGFKNSKTGNIVIECKYNTASDFNEDLAVVCLNMKWGFIDKTGKEVIPLKYDRCYSFSESMAAIQLDQKWGFVNKNGDEVISPKYENFYFNLTKKIFGFSEGLVGVQLDDKWGFVNKNGIATIPFMYDMVYYFYKKGDMAMARVVLDGYAFCINTNNMSQPGDCLD